MCAARAALALGRAADAENFLAGGRESTNPLVAVEAWLLAALAADHSRDDHRSMSALNHALTLAQPQDIRRPFVALGHARLADILRHQQKLAPGNDRFRHEILTELQSCDAKSPPRPLSKPLTDREHIVLNHLAALETNEEVAAELHISVNTVKSHARSVYRKLAVANRRQAVNRARDLGLL